MTIEKIDMSDSIHRLGLKLKFIYSIFGLAVGSGSITLGCILFLSGITGGTTWTFSALGIAESNLSDAAPGIILFVVGLFLVVFTRFKVKDKAGADGRVIMYKK